MFLVTTLPAPITAPSQMLTDNTVALEPMVTLFAITVRPQLSEFGSGLPSLNKVIREHHAVAYEAVTSDRHILTNKGMRLNLTSVTDNRVLLNLNKRANEHIIFKLTAINVAWFDDRDILATGNVSNLYL